MNLVDTEKLAELLNGGFNSKGCPVAFSFTKSLKLFRHIGCNEEKIFETISGDGERQEKLKLLIDFFDDEGNSFKQSILIQIFNSFSFFDFDNSKFELGSLENQKWSIFEQLQEFIITHLGIKNISKYGVLEIHQSYASENISGETSNCISEDYFRKLKPNVVNDQEEKILYDICEYFLNILDKDSVKPQNKILNIEADKQRIDDKFNNIDLIAKIIKKFQ